MHGAVKGILFGSDITHGDIIIVIKMDILITEKTYSMYVSSASDLCETEVDTLIPRPVWIQNEFVWLVAYIHKCPADILLLLRVTIENKVA